jgi:hypothetical protein
VSASPCPRPVPVTDVMGTSWSSETSVAEHEYSLPEMLSRWIPPREWYECTDCECDCECEWIEWIKWTEWLEWNEVAEAGRKSGTRDGEGANGEAEVSSLRFWKLVGEVVGCGYGTSSEMECAAGSAESMVGSKWNEPSAGMSRWGESLGRLSSRSYVWSAAIHHLVVGFSR